MRSSSFYRPEATGRTLIHDQFAEIDAQPVVAEGSFGAFAPFGHLLGDSS
jgi:hypothetical protein